MNKSIANIFLLISLISLGLFGCKSDQPSKLSETSETAKIIETKEEPIEQSRFQQLKFFVNINAPVEKVYSTVIDSVGFSDWTSLFSPISYFKGDWSEGSKILFISDMEDGSKVGMVSQIKKNIPNQIISIEYLGMIQDGKEVMTGEEVESFKGAMESYSFSTNGTLTTMLVETDVFVEESTFFEETWPKALNRIKEICETK